MVSKLITLECAGGPTVQTTLAAWNAFIDSQIRIYDGQIRRVQTEQIKRSRKKQAIDQAPGLETDITT